MPSHTIAHVANVLAIAILISVVTAGASIAASGIGHAFAARSATCGSVCGLGPHQAMPAHIGKVNAAIAMRGFRH